MSKKIRKAIIPAGGLGISFLPATKTQPKEMLPIVDKPALQYIVEEAVASGIEEILIVTGRNKSCIEDHFDKSILLELTLKNKNDLEKLEMVQSISDMATIYYVRQKEPRGLGDAIKCARSFIGEDEYFAILLGDDIIDSETPCLKQIIDVHCKYSSPIIGVQDVKKKETSKYGIIEPLEVDENIYRVKSLVEKPLKKAPSNKAIMGRYIVSPRIFDLIDKQPPGVCGEIQLTDALNELLKIVSVYACNIDGKRYDLGNKLDYLEANIDFALKRNDLNSELLNMIKEKVEQIENKEMM